MALITCPNCGATISAHLSSCPYCPGERPPQPQPGTTPAPSLWQQREVRLRRLGRVLGLTVIAATLFAVLRLVMIPLGLDRTASTGGDRPDPLKALTEDVARIRERLDDTSQQSAAPAPATPLPAPLPAAPAPSLQERANQGDMEAQFQLAKSMYPHQATVDAYDNSLEWFRKAAEQGHVTAQLQLGWMYYQGEGVVPDRQAALHWFQAAADQGSELGRSNIAAIENEIAQAEAAATASFTPLEREPEPEPEVAAEITDAPSPSFIALPNGVIIPGDLPPGSVVVVNPPPVQQEIVYNDYSRREDYISYQPNAGFYGGRNPNRPGRDIRNPGRPNPTPAADRPSRYDQVGFVTPLSGRVTPYTGRITPLSKGVTPLSEGVTPLGPK